MLNGIQNSSLDLWPVPGNQENGEPRGSLRTDETGRNGSALNDATSQELTPAEKKQVEKLKTTDRRVRQHEQAHQAAAGGLAVSGATFQYATGPDGKRYAVGGEVRISAPSGGDPDKQLENARKMKRAALAPAEPSAQDRSVAAAAARMEVQARMEMQQGTDEEEATPGAVEGDAGASQTQSLASGNTTGSATAAEPLPLPGIPQDDTRPGMIARDNAKQPGMPGDESRFSRLPGQKEEGRPGLLTREAMERYTNIIRQDLAIGDPYPEALMPYMKNEDNSGLRVSINA